MCVIHTIMKRTALRKSQRKSQRKSLQTSQPTGTCGGAMHGTALDGTAVDGTVVDTKPTIAVRLLELAQSTPPPLYIGSGWTEQTG